MGSSCCDRSGNSRRWSPPRIDKDEVCEAELWDANRHHNRSTKRQPGGQLLANLNFNIPQVVWQHKLLWDGICYSVTWFLFTIYSSFQRWKSFENRLGFDIAIVIAVSWWSTFCTKRWEMKKQTAPKTLAKTSFKLYWKNILAISDFPNLP